MVVVIVGILLGNSFNIGVVDKVCVFVFEQVFEENFDVKGQFCEIVLFGKFVKIDCRIGMIVYFEW